MNLMRGAIYTFERVANGIVYIVDLVDEFPDRLSITNDAEDVYDNVTRRFPNHRVIYQDSYGEWTELKRGASSIVFLPAEGPSYED